MKIVPFPQKPKPEEIPETCYFRISSPDDCGRGPIYAEWNAVSLEMLLIIEELCKDIRDVLFHEIQDDTLHKGS